MMNSQSALVVLAVLLMSGTALGQSCTRDDCSTMCGGNMRYQSANGAATCTCTATGLVACSIAAPANSPTTAASTSVQTCGNAGIASSDQCSTVCGGNMQFTSANNVKKCTCTATNTIACEDVGMQGMGSLGTRPAVAVWALVATAMFAAMLTL
jgi:hypothetical protein